MKWHYVGENNDKLVTTEEGLKELFNQGGVTGDTLVWKEGMTNWQPYSKVISGDANLETIYAASEASIAPSKSGLTSDCDPDVIRHLASYLARNSKWLKFAGVVWFVLGILYCVTIIYAIFGWVFIWQGRLLMQSADAVVDAHENGNRVAFETAQDKISLSIKILGVSTLVGLIFTIITIVFYVIFAIYMVVSGGFDLQDLQSGLSASDSLRLG